MNFWKTVNQVIKDADVVLEVIDARHVDLTRHQEIEDKVEKAGKTLIYVLNKCDLVEKEKLNRQGLKKAVFVSSTEYHGLKKLKERIMIEGKRVGWEKIRVGVVGYPNVGKSSLINALKGKKSAPTSSHSGHTKGVQKIVKRGLIFLDTPGVIPYKEKEEEKHAIIGAKDASRVKDPEGVVYDILEQFPGKLKEKYNVEEDDDFLEEIAKKKHFLKKGKKPDTMRAAKTILQEWQHG